MLLNIGSYSLHCTGTPYPLAATPQVLILYARTIVLSSRGCLKSQHGGQNGECLSRVQETSLC